MNRPAPKTAACGGAASGLGRANAAAPRLGPRLAAAFVLLTLVACTSPEARRVRGGGPGADVGNRGAVVEFHRGAEPYYRTPCVTAGVPCSGPAAIFGTNRLIS